MAYDSFSILNRAIIYCNSNRLSLTGILEKTLLTGSDAGSGHLDPDKSFWGITADRRQGIIPAMMAVIKILLTIQITPPLFFCLGLFVPSRYNEKQKLNYKEERKSAIFPHFQVMSDIV